MPFRVPDRTPRGSDAAQIDIPKFILSHVAGAILDGLDGITFGIFNLDDLADDLRATKLTATSAQTQAGLAGQTAVAASANAATARTEASQALTAAQSVEATAQEALATADIAYENAQYWKDECVVASAEVLLGVNELLIGIVMDVPTGRTRFLTDLHFAFSAQPGTIVIQTRVVAADGVTLRTAHTATITANQVRRSYNNLGVQVYDKERVFWNVVSSTSPATVLQVALVGVLTPAVAP